MAQYVPTPDQLRRKDVIERRQASADPEALARRERSNARLRTAGIPVNANLPVIETQTEAALRSADAIVRRAIALVLVAVKGEGPRGGIDEVLVRNLVLRFEAQNDFSPNEASFIGNPAPSDQERIQFVWRYEAVHPLLWAIGFVDRLGPADQIIDVQGTTAIFREMGRAGLIGGAKLRPAAEVLDEADFVYRAHWAVKDARVRGAQTPAGLDAGVVVERHRALNWLIGYMGQAWDDVSTDT